MASKADVAVAGCQYVDDSGSPTGVTCDEVPHPIHAHTAAGWLTHWKMPLFSHLVPTLM